MDLKDEQWAVLEPLIPIKELRADGKGRPRRDNRDVLNGILWILRTGAAWHDFRRTYISDLINQYDLVTAQKIIGHSSANITAKYDRTWQEKAREAARMREISLRSNPRED
jgi:transposase